MTVPSAGTTTASSAPSVGLIVSFAGGKAIAVLAGVATSVLLARVLGAEGLGRWTLILGAGTLLHTAFINWTHLPTARFGREEWVRSHVLDQTLAARLPLLVVVVGGCSLLLLFQPGNWLSAWFQLQPSDWWMVGLAAMGAWLAAEAQATLQATDGFRLQSILAPSLAVGSIVVIGFLGWSGSVSLEAVALGMTVVPIVGWGAAWSSRIRVGAPPRFSLMVEHIRYAWPMVPGFALGYFSTWAPHLLLSRMTSISDVGHFGLAYQFLAAAVTVNGLLPTFLLPWLIQRAVVSPGAPKLYLQAISPTLLTLWMLATIWVVAALPLTLPVLVGVNFAAATPLLVLLLMALPTAVVTSLYTVLFDIEGRLGRLVVLMVPPIIANVTVCLIAVPDYGAAAAAVGTVAFFWVSQVLYIWDQHRELSVPSGSAWWLQLTGCGLGLSQAFIEPAPGPRLLWALLASVVLVLVARSAGTVSAPVVQRLGGVHFRPLAIVVMRCFSAH